MLSEEGIHPRKNSVVYIKEVHFKMPISNDLLVTIIIALVVAVIFFFIGMLARKAKAEKAIGSAEKEAKRILSDAIKTAEARKKELLIEAKDEVHHLRQET